MASRNRSLRKLSLAGIGAALVFVLTFFVKVPIPATEGYVNLGDAAILVLTYILGPFASIPAGIGAALADLIGGYGHYVIPTLVIKSVMGGTAGLVMRRDSKVPLFKKIFAGVIAELIMVGGYFAFEALPFMYGPAVALTSVPFNLIQGAAAIIVFIPLSYVRPLDGERRRLM